MNTNDLYSLTKTTQFRLKLYPKKFDQTRDFYQQVLHYPVLKSWTGPKNQGVMFDTGAAIIELLTPPEQYVPIQGANLSLQVVNVRALWEKLKGHPNIVKPLNLRPWGDLSFRIVDPEGFQISFFTPQSLLE